MSTSRDFPFSYSPEVRALLGPPSTLNLAVRAAYPELLHGWANRFAHPTRDNLRGPSVCINPGTSVPAGTILGIFAGTIFLGDDVRGPTLLPLPMVRLHGVDVCFMVDGAARGARYPSSAEAVLYSHECEDPTVVGEWWMGGPVPCLVARSARLLPSYEILSWNFDVQGSYTMSQAEARAWRRGGHRSARCTCNMPRDCPLDRFVRIADSPDSSEGSDW